MGSDRTISSAGAWNLADIRCFKHLREALAGSFILGSLGDGQSHSAALGSPSQQQQRRLLGRGPGRTAVPFCYFRDTNKYRVGQGQPDARSSPLDRNQHRQAAEFFAKHQLELNKTPLAFDRSGLRHQRGSVLDDFRRGVMLTGSQRPYCRHLAHPLARRNALM